MAIQLTTINGTDSIAATRITINDNFATLSDAVNSVLQIVNISTGFLDNVSAGWSNPKINTGSLTSVGEINSQTGDIIAYQGNLRLGVNAFIEFGNGSNIKVSRYTKYTGPGGSSTISVLNFASNAGLTGPGLVGALVLPRQTTTDIKAIINPDLGSIVYDTAQNAVAYCVGTSSGIGATGTWYKISATGATAL